MLNLYRHLLVYRRNSPALRWGSYQPIDLVPDDCCVYLRQMGEERVLVAINFSEEERVVSLPGLGEAIAVLSTYMDRPGPVDLARLTLRSSEGLVVGLSNTDFH